MESEWTPFHGLRPRSRPSRRTDPCLGEHVQNQLVHLQDIAKMVIING